MMDWDSGPTPGNPYEDMTLDQAVEVCVKAGRQVAEREARKVEQAQASAEFLVRRIAMEVRRHDWEDHLATLRELEDAIRPIVAKWIEFGGATHRLRGSGSKLHAVIYQDTLDGGFIAERLDLPGCLSQGETVEEALKNLTVAGSMCSNLKAGS